MCTCESFTYYIAICKLVIAIIETYTWDKMRCCGVLLFVIILFVASLVGCLLWDLFRPGSGFVATENCLQFYLPPAFSVFSNLQNYCYQSWLSLFCGFCKFRLLKYFSISWQGTDDPEWEATKRKFTSISQSNFAWKLTWGHCSICSAVQNICYGLNKVETFSVLWAVSFAFILFEFFLFTFFTSETNMLV